MQKAHPSLGEEKEWALIKCKFWLLKNETLMDIYYRR